MISIIIPVFNGAVMLRRSLTSLRQHAPADCEVIIVDDCSADSSGEAALSPGCRIVRTEQRCGPGAARNLGAHVARGDILVFFDADVCVHGGTISQLTGALDDESVGAVFGSYDSVPDARHLVSRFRNLLHHYVHQTAIEEASSFWAGCGAVRKRVFFEIGGFDPSYANSSVEDIEFGLRLRKAGQRIVICKSAQVTHLKRWTLWTMCTTDLWRRGVPWSRLILRERQMPNDLNLKQSQRLSVVLSFTLLGVLGVAAWHQPWVALIPLLLMLAIQILDGFETGTDYLACAACGLAVGTMSLWAAIQAPALLILGLASALGILTANAGFYGFLARSEGRAFAVAVFPLHLLFFSICGVAFMIAAGGHLMASGGAQDTQHRDRVPLPVAQHETS